MVLFFIFADEKMKSYWRIKMCDIISRIKNKSPEDLLSDYAKMRNPFSVDIVEVATNIGIELSGVDFTEMEQSDMFKDDVKQFGPILGAVYIENERVEIAYSTVLSDGKRSMGLSDDEKKDKLKRRQRFTIAHEIAHCCLHIEDGNVSHVEYRMEQTSYIDPREREANIFAGKLLIPTEKITMLADYFDFHLPVSRLADIFLVSKSVMSARINYLIESGVLPASTQIIDT